MCAKDEDKVCSACLECNGLDLPSCAKHHRISKLIYEAQLEAVEKWMAMTYDCIGNNGVISNEHFNYLAKLRKAVGGTR